MTIPKTIKTDEKIFRITNFDGDTFLCNTEHIRLEDLDQIKRLDTLWNFKFESFSKLQLKTLIVESNITQANELKGTYQFVSPYHKGKKMLPFNILGCSYSTEYPVSVYTVEYRGFSKKDNYGDYKLSVIKEFIDSGFITKTNN